MKLRPHHLLCTQAYRGKGYDEEFVAVMDQITDALKKDENMKINLVFHTDDICLSCPRMLADGLCADNEKVKQIDGKMIHYFRLREQEYVYRELAKEVIDNLTGEIADDICKTCEWYETSSCKEILLRKSAGNSGLDY